MVEKHRNFVQAYLQCFDAAEAARRAQCGHAYIVELREGGRFHFCKCPHLERSCPNAADIVRCRRTGANRKPVDNDK